jgi:uncharacterized damage-inducible protein DinB
MTIPQQLAKHFRDVHFGGNWTVSSLRDQLKDLSWEQAAKKVEGFNSILALVFHMSYYTPVLSNVLRGKPLEGHDKHSWETPVLNSQQEWEKLLVKIWEEAETAAKLIEDLPEEKLGEDFADGKYGTWLRNIQGTTEHLHYHLGQIVILKKLVSPERELQNKK